MGQSGKTLREAAIGVLRALGPTHYRTLTNEILNRSLASSSAEQPENVLNKILSSDIRREGTQSEFIRLAPGVYGLRALHAPRPEPESEVPEESPDGRSEVETGLLNDSRRVRIPLFPTYGEVRQLLKVWPGRLKAHVTGLHTALAQLRGTPQNPVAWTDPDTWIPQKLSGDTRNLAMAIWTESDHGVNPRPHLRALAAGPEIRPA